MKPSLWTSMYNDDTPAVAIEKLAALGWQAFELSCEHLAILQYGGAPALADYAATRDRLGVDIPQAHSTITADVASLDANRRAADLALIHRDIDTCAALGIKNIVIHPGGWYDHAQSRADIDEMDRLRLKAFAELAAHCERVSTRLAIENMSDNGAGFWGGRRFGSIVEEILGLIDQIGSPALGVCLDTSHANIQQLNQPAAVRTCGDKLIALHISDNDTSGDQHKSPGYGTVDFPGIINALRGIDFKFNFNLEIPGETRGQSQPMVELRVKYALGVCHHLLA